MKSVVVGGICALSMALSLGTSASAQNVVPNGEFNVDTAGWTLNTGDNGGSISLDSTTGSPTSPSMKLVPGGTPLTLVDSACLLIDTSQNIDLHADLKRVPIDVQLPSPTGVQLTLYASTDTSCLSGGGIIVLSYDNDCVPIGTSGWRHCAIVDRALPVGTHSVRLDFAVGALAISGNIDNIGLGPTGTVPVTLQSFSID